MTGTGWEFYSIKFSVVLTMLVSIIIFLSAWLGSHTSNRFYRVDTMAGDEGED